MRIKRVFVIVFLLAFASVQFLLILRHKSPYISDSLMYEYTYLRIKGETPTSSLEKVQNKIGAQINDQLTKEIIENPTNFYNSYPFFEKRILYPVAAALTYQIIRNDYIALFVPIFFSYLGVILLVLLLFEKATNTLFATIGTALFLSFYHFLDYSTYYLTDTIGTFFWLVKIFAVYSFISNHNRKWLVLFVFSLSLSLLNREQNALFLICIMLSLIIAYILKLSKTTVKNLTTLLVITTLIVVTYFVMNSFLNGKTLFDTLVYTQGGHVLQPSDPTLEELIKFWTISLFGAHVLFISDVIRHHWWVTIILFTPPGIYLVFKRKKADIVLDIVMFSSGVASYFSIFALPVVSYRYFYPVAITALYFFIKFTAFLFQTDDAKTVKSHES